MVKKQVVALTEAQQLAADKTRTLRTAAFSGGLFLPEKPSEFPKLAPGKALVAVSGQDIFRRSTLRKGKYLFSFPGRIGTLASSAGAKLGQLEHLDTPHPTLRIDVEGGSFLLRGVILAARHKFLTLQLNPKAVHGDALASAASPAIVCDDVFDKVVVFSEAVWLGGDPALNPACVPQPLPPGLVQAAPPAGAAFIAGCGQPYTVASAVTGDGGGGSGASAPGADAGASGSGRSGRARRTVRYVEADEDDVAAASSDGDDGGAAGVPVAAPRAGVVSTVAYGAEQEVIVARRPGRGGQGGAGGSGAPPPHPRARGLPQPPTPASVLSSSSRAARDSQLLPASAADSAVSAVSAAAAPRRRGAAHVPPAHDPGPALDIPKSLRPAGLPLGWGALASAHSSAAAAAAAPRSIWASPTDDVPASSAASACAADGWLFDDDDDEEPGSAAVPSSAASAPVMAAGRKRPRAAASAGRVVAIDLSDDDSDDGSGEEGSSVAPPRASSAQRPQPPRRSSSGSRGVAAAAATSDASPSQGSGSGPRVTVGSGARGAGRLGGRASSAHVSYAEAPDSEDSGDDESVAELPVESESD